MSEYARRGTLKIFLGYAAGVGKTYQMLDEAHKLKIEAETPTNKAAKAEHDKNAAALGLTTDKPARQP